MFTTVYRELEYLYMWSHGFRQLKKINSLRYNYLNLKLSILKKVENNCYNLSVVLTSYNLIFYIEMGVYVSK